MFARIRLQEQAETELPPPSAGTSALDRDECRTLLLRFRIDPVDPESLDALRHARRSMLREEWTRGREPDEPPLEDAVFSSAEVRWLVRPEQRISCLARLEELISRANRVLEELRPFEAALPRSRA